MACFVFGGGTDVEHDHVAGTQSLCELVTTDLFDAVRRAEVGAGELVEVGDVSGGDVAHRSPQLSDAFAREAVEDAGAVAPGGEHASPCQGPEGGRWICDALGGLTREGVHPPP